MPISQKTYKTVMENRYGRKAKNQKPRKPKNPFALCTVSKLEREACRRLLRQATAAQQTSNEIVS